MPFLWNPLTSELNISASSGGASNVFSVGQFNGDTGNVPAWRFTGTNTGTGVGGFTVLPTPPNTGMDAITMQDVGTYLEWYIDGVFMMDFGKGIPGQGEFTIAGDMIPFETHYSIGRSNAPWIMFSRGALEVADAGGQRAVLIKPGGGGGVVGYGTDMSDSCGSAYFRSYDSVTQLPVDNVWSVKPIDGTVTQILGDSATGSNNAYSGIVTAATSVNGKAGNITISGANASGSGAGGDVLLKGGTSLSGQIGDVFIPSISSDPIDTPNSHTGFVPIRYNSMDNKLFIYNSGWKSISLS